MSEEAICLRTESNTIIQLNGLRNKLSCNPHIYRFSKLSSEKLILIHDREQININETHPVNMQRMSMKFSTLNVIAIFHPLHSIITNHCGKGRKNDIRARGGGYLQ